MTNKVPVQSLIDHIKTAIDVDPWAKNMVENLLKEQPEIVRCKDCRRYPECCRPNTDDPNWFCADGERREDNGQADGDAD